MDAVNNKSPLIRFPEFTIDWEQCKLGNVVESIKNGYNYKADGNRDYRYKITRIESISSGVINKDKLGSSDTINESYRLKNGDILFSHINSLQYIANTAIYTDDLGEIYHGMNLLNIRVNHNDIDAHFLLHLLKKETSRNWFRMVAKPAVNQASISTTEVASFEFYMPDIREQKRIGEFLTNIDNIIVLLQHKCDEMKQLKQAMLQKMFPKDGEKTPEIRFPGFTDDWEQRKFGEVVQRESISAISGAGLPCVEYEDIITEDGILNKDIFSKTAEKKGILFEGTEVLYGKLRPYLHNWLKPQFKGVAVGDWWVLQSDILQQNFLYRLIQTKQFDEIANQSAGSKMPRADWGLVSNAMFNIPSNQEEQEKIGAFFEYLDNTITLHQRKCDEMKQLKQAMLQKMFI